MDPKWNISVENFDLLKAVYAYAFTDTPEDDVWKKIQLWAKPKGLLLKEKGTRVFGRNTYPTDKPEPHGYELYITIKEPIKVSEEIMVGEIPGGLYAILRSALLEDMPQAWSFLWNWLNESDYEFTGWKKGEHGWVNGYEEHLNPFDDKPLNEWLFNLMIPVKEKVR